ELARGEPARALALVERLIATAPNLTAESVLPRLWLLRGEALMCLKRFAEAENVLQLARAKASTRGLRPMLWHIHHALGKVYQAQDRRKDADREYSAARAIAAELAGGLSDANLRETLLAGAHTLLPRPRALTARRAAQERFGGLSPREREIAV